MRVSEVKSLASGFFNVTDRCVYVRHRKHTYFSDKQTIPNAYQDIYVTNQNQSVQFTSSKKEFWHICNSSEQKIANRQTQPFLNQQSAEESIPGEKTHNVEVTSLFSFCTRDYLPDNIRPGYDPLKEVYICWGPPFDLK